jgi:hypothetical protein
VTGRDIKKNTTSGITKVTVIPCNYCEGRNNFKIHEILELEKYSHRLYRLGTNNVQVIGETSSKIQCFSYRLRP